MAPAKKRTAKSNPLSIHNQKIMAIRKMGEEAMKPRLTGPVAEVGAKVWLVCSISGAHTLKGHTLTEQMIYASEQDAEKDLHFWEEDSFDAWIEEETIQKWYDQKDVESE